MKVAIGERVGFAAFSIGLSGLVALAIVGAAELVALSGAKDVAVGLFAAVTSGGIISLFVPSKYHPLCIAERSHTP